MMLRSSHRLMIMFRSLRYQHSYRVHPMVVKKHGADQGPTSGSTKPVSNAFLSPVFNRAPSFKDKIALKDRYGQYTYGRLFNASHILAKQYEEKIGEKQQQKIAFLCPNDASYLLTQWACWMAGHIAVPLSPLHPAAMLEYFIRDADANLIVTTTEFQEIVEKVCHTTGRSHLILDSRIRDKALTNTVCGVTNDNVKNKLLNSSDIWNSDNKPSERISVGSKIENLGSCNSDNTLSAKVLNKKTEELFVSKLPESFYKTSNAMIIYTSGSTGQPKGVLISHQNLDAQINSMVKAWQWSSNDSILHTLPLHHIHGIVNALLCPLAVGARCVMLPSFDASEVWKQLLGVKMPECERVNMFMGVPTMYAKLVDKYMQSLTKNERMIDYVRASCSQKIRLFVSGSAPLPTQVFEKWEFITGHKILERYGMSETGMVLTNPLDGERNPGAVGNPFPGVEVRIVDNKNNVLVKGSSVGTQVIAKENETLSGELQVKGSNVFKGYYQKPEQTAETFADGWFKTGDYAQYSDKAYKILGRQSVDIIKTGGYKVSAVHVETALRDHPDIVDVAVVGISDITWGQKVAAVVETNKGQDLDLVKLKEWVKTKLPPYEVPSLFQIVKSIPRNTLGKVNKKELVNVVFPKNNKEI